MRKIFALIGVVFFLSGCITPQTQYATGSSAEVALEVEKQRRMALKTQYNDMRRIQRVAFSILKSNVGLCKENVGPLYGIGVWNELSVSRDFQGTAKQLYGLDEHLSVYITVGGSPAAKAGLDRGDKVLKVNGVPVKKGRYAFKDFGKKLRESGFAKTKITVSRNGKEKTYTVFPAKGCAFPAGLDIANDKNAYADGKAIFINSGMMRFVKNDNELALIIAHELAHNAMGHIDAKTANMAGAGLIGLLLEGAVVAAGGYSDGTLTTQMMNAGAGAYSVEFEQEADYVGMYMLARSGRPTSNVASFWRRMASQDGHSAIATRSTHPATAERFIALEKTHQEIQRKRAKGKALIPNIKPKKKHTTYKKKSDFN